MENRGFAADADSSPSPKNMLFNPSAVHECSIPAIQVADPKETGTQHLSCFRQGRQLGIHADIMGNRAEKSNPRAGGGVVSVAPPRAVSDSVLFRPTGYSLVRVLAYAAGRQPPAAIVLAL